MTPRWIRSISEADLAFGKSAMLTNMVAGDTLAIPAWRYSWIGCVAYAILRSAVYCVRHFYRDDSFSSQDGCPTYIYFTPTCEIGVRSIEQKFPGNVIGFKGRKGYNYPLRRLLIATIACFRSRAIWQWIFSDRRWRPWISDVIFYILTLRWADERFAGIPAQVFVYSNDHCCFDRGIVDAVSLLGHTTVYVQHAAVTDIFPPLSAHFSLLDGEHALDIYRGIEGSQGTVLICGRQYELAAIRKRRRETRTVLACTSTIDSVESWRSALCAIRDAGYKVLLRTHPSDRQVHSWKQMASEIGVQWVDPLYNSLATSLEQSSLVFAGQSGVLLEASLSGAFPILLQFDEDTQRGLYDYFRFGALGLAYLTTPNNVQSTLENIQSGEATVSGTIAGYFDVSYFSNINLQIKAFELILSQKFINYLSDNDIFHKNESISNSSLNIYTPNTDAMIN